MIDHESFEARDMFLQALEQVGVDNWEGYDDAVALYKQWIEEEEKETK
jgi:hypothetical protein